MIFWFGIWDAAALRPCWLYFARISLPILVNISLLFFKVRDFARGGLREELNLSMAATHFINGFRIGKFGRILLDDELLPKGMPCWEK